MEEFKKPCLPVLSGKPETSEIASNKPNENLENFEETAALTTLQKQLCPYKIPQWSDRPNDEDSYSFEVLKSGQIIDKVKSLQKKAYWTFGRLPENDVEMAHPTISRFHAILQYRPKFKQEECAAENEDKSKKGNERSGPPEGWYLFDLGSTHGTFLNKQRIPPNVYIRIRVGHMLRLGASTRSYILQGPSEDEEPESDLSVTELKAKRQQELKESELEKKRLAEEAIERANNEGCSWGMTEDADEETDLTHNPYASTNNEELFLDDPKKTLRGYFEREGLELVYKCEEMSAGSFVCRVELPLDDANGRSIVAEVVHKGKKKDCVVQCALEACRLLDRHGVLRQANQEPLKRKLKPLESDSDDDEFWDRTGDVARKKLKKANANTSVTLTYADLLKQENDLEEQIKQIESSITDYQEQQKRLKAQKSDEREGEDLDEFMQNLEGKELNLDKLEIRKLRLEEQRLKSEKQKVQRLIKIAKPVDLSFSTHTTHIKQTQANEQAKVKKQLQMIGKRNQFSKFKIIKVETPVIKGTKPATFLNSDEEEVEDEDNEKSNESNSSKTNQITESKDDTQETESCLINSDITNQSYKPETTTDDNYEKQTNDSSNTDKNNENSKDLQTITETNTAEVSNNSKKRRQRIRQRGKRQEVDMCDDGDYESADKYAKWVPPENQTGDGFTELNKRFGY